MFNSTSKNTRITHFSATVLFLYLLKPLENPWFSDVFRGYRKKPLTWNRLTNLFPMHSFSTPWKQKTKGFVIFSGGRERLHWEQMGNVLERFLLSSPSYCFFFTRYLVQQEDGKAVLTKQDIDAFLAQALSTQLTSEHNTQNLANIKLSQVDARYDRAFFLITVKRSSLISLLILSEFKRINERLFSLKLSEKPLVSGGIGVN